MANYKTPGVFVEEISKLPPSIAQVETAIPAFVGFTEKAEKNGNTLVGKPTRIKSLAEYVEYFGMVDPADITVNVTVSIDDDGSTKTIRKIVPQLDGGSTLYRMYHSLQLYFANGGGPCYIVSAQTTDNITAIQTHLQDAVNALKYEDEPTLILIPDAHLASNDTNYYTLFNSALVQSADLGDRFTIIDIAGSGVTTMRNASLTNLKYGATYYPDLKTMFNYIYDETQVHVTEIVNGTPEGAATPLSDIAGLQLGDFEYNAIKDAIQKELKVVLPPGSAMAGVYARVDNDRGVWKAPANVPVSAVIETMTKISDEDQKSLNVDTTAGKSVNAIRFFTGKGILVWGARTLAGNDNEWRYISVRRFYNMVEESVKKSSSWVVFEPNDANTWVKVKTMIENYLTTLWRQGALAGSAPEKAFFVKVGLGETMTSLDIMEGRMNIEIGMAAVRPAEFVILKFSHKMQEA